MMDVFAASGDTTRVFFSSESEIEYASSRDRAEMFLTRFGGFVMIPHSVAIA